MNRSNSTTAPEVSTLAHRNDPDTSHFAAARLSDLSPLRRAVLELIREHASTVTELRVRYESVRAERGYPRLHDLHNIARRVSDLHDLGVIRDSGRRRATPLGRPSVVWEVAA